MGQACFVYGTLMFDEVLQALINRSPRKSSAVIRGYRRYCIRDQVFPGTVAATDSQVQGVVLFDISPQELEIFDEFEGEEYDKVSVQPELDEGAEAGLVGECSVYLWRHDLRGLLYGEWDPEGFRERYLQSYVAMCTGFAAELREQKGRPGNRPLGFQ